LIAADSIDRSQVFAGSRYDKGDADFLIYPPGQGPIPVISSKALTEAETAELHDFEKNIFFEALPAIEELAQAGRKIAFLRPLKPVGLADPAPSACRTPSSSSVRTISRGAFYQLVGFQTA